MKISAPVAGLLLGLMFGNSVALSQGTISDEQRNRRGMEAACRSYINEWNATNDLYNAEKDKKKRAAFVKRLNEINAKMKEMNC